MTDDRDHDLLEEQIRFYQADAASFGAWLEELADEGNGLPVAMRFRAGRAETAALLAGLAEAAPLGRVLEIAAGTGMLAELVVPHAGELVLVDTSAESLDLARGRLGQLGRCGVEVACVEADVFEWLGREPAPGPFDTVFFSAWLHHVPMSWFNGFWAMVRRVLAPGGRVLFDFPASGPSTHPDPADLPPQPSNDYRMYRPEGGVSVREHFGRRWRVVHVTWEPDELLARLAAMGWRAEIAGPGWFEGVHWVLARRLTA